MAAVVTPDLRERARGALLGLAVGDALGAPAENMRPSEIRARWGRITGYVQDEPAGTDDTEYAIFCGLLLARHGFALTAADVEAAWHEWIADRDEGPSRSRPGSPRAPRRPPRPPAPRSSRRPPPRRPPGPRRCPPRRG
jgi:ADP-ribosylglycohydrolase